MFRGFPSFYGLGSFIFEKRESAVFVNKKRPEILRFQVFLVEISGIEPLTS